ncbi:hypothetical protein ABL78_7645 [Leptomonas seymouri]|uniref:Uncharacterized protein n=1 Tax=Leptomonas seymouri TaxID=5684 RepID=A0A0N1IGX6_LEPSE|nr:hypothetical protein ABL78_7645 [Leptomonas seymouri]|eukprot:KPI83324.1 hypothetical protein ABL78_7645 [Leptomonas seymouri]
MSFAMPTGKGDEGSSSGDAADATGDGVSPRARLLVPPPEQPWTVANLACAVNVHAMQGRVHQRSSSDAGGTATTIISFPFTLPGLSSVTKLPSLSPLLPRPVGERAFVDSQRRHRKPQPLQSDKGDGNEVLPVPGVVRSGMMNDSNLSASSTSSTITTEATTTDEDVVPFSSLPLGPAPNTSLPTASLSGVPQVGVISPNALATADLQGHPLFPAPSDVAATWDTQHIDLSPQTPCVPVFGEPTDAGVVEHPMTLLCMHNSHNRGSSIVRSGILRSPLQSSTPTAPSLADLFVGLQQPRLHRLPRRSGDAGGLWHLAGWNTGRSANTARNHADGSTLPPSSVNGSVTPHLASSEQDGTSREASTYEVVEDDAGAHTPTVYRSPQLPHWWRSIMTPTMGTRVCLRPCTPRLEFWWIDRLGSEAYEFIQVILKHSLEGMVTRESGESVVVVEFCIPAEYLDRTSFATWRPQAPSASQASSAAAPATALWRVERADGGDDDDCEEEVATSKGPAKVNTPPYVDLCGSTVNPPAPSRLVAPVSKSVPRPPIRYTNAPAAPPGTAPLGPLSSVQAGNAHPDAAEYESSHLTTPTAIVLPSGVPSGLAEGPATLAVPHPPTGAAPTNARRPSPLSSGRASDGAEIPISAVQHRHADLTLSSRPPSPEAGNVYSSLSTLNQNSSVVTADGGHSDPFMAERRLCEEPPLTRILTTSPLYKTLLIHPSGEQTGIDGEAVVRPQGVGQTFRQSASPCRFSTTDGPAIPVVHGGAIPPPPAPLTPCEGDYTPDLGNDNFNSASIADSRDSVTGEDTERSFTPPFASSPPLEQQRGRSPLYRLPTTVLVAPTLPDRSQQSSSQLRTSANFLQQQQQQHFAHPCVPSTDRTGSVNSSESGSRQSRSNASPYATSTYRDDHFLLCVDPLVKSEDRSWSPESRAMSRQHSPSLASSYYDPFSRSKSYEEWLRTSNILSHDPALWSLRASSAAGAGSAEAVSGSSGQIATALSWSRDHPIETASVLEKTASSNEIDKDTAHQDDSVIVRLSLPSSVCIPVVAVRLHALKLLHPLLHALSISYTSQHPPPESAGEDEMESALRAMANVSPFTSELVGHTTVPDYDTAVKVVSDAIRIVEQEKLTLSSLSAELPRTDATTEAAASNSSASASIGAAPQPLQPRDVSILYTIRSHLYFHMSPEHLYDSLKDAEKALSCCPTHEHVCNTYEVLAACLISFGHTAQVERLVARLRHRCRLWTPLLTRLNRVTQVMVSYGSLFLHQQLNPALLRRGGTPAHPTNPRASSQNEGILPSPLDGGMYLSREAVFPPRAAAAAVCSPERRTVPLADVGACDNPNILVSSTTMPLVVIGGGIVDPPLHWGRQSSQQHRIGSATVAGQSATEAPRTLSYEVCPLLLGYYGKSLHRQHEISDNPYPLPLSPRAAKLSSSPNGGGAVTVVPTKNIDGIKTQRQRNHNHRSPSARPSSDVCHRRLFLLETLFPSVLPLTAANGPQQLAPTPRVISYRGSATSRGVQNMRCAVSSGDAGAATRISEAVAKEKKIKPQDFLYDRDSMFALLASTTETMIAYGTISMRYFGRHIRLSATRRISKGSTILLEKPALILALWPLPYGRAAHQVGTEPTSDALPPQTEEGSGRSTTAMKSSVEVAQRAVPDCCAQCGRQRLTHPIHCPGKCGLAYCSEACRRESLRLYHVVECSGLADLPPHPATAASGVDTDDTADARVRGAVAALQVIFSEWYAFMYCFAGVASCSPPATIPPSPQKSGSHSSAGCPASATEKCSPPPILTMTGQRAMARLVAMMLCVVLPVESLPQLREGNEAFIQAWKEERHAMVRAVARTLYYRGLMVPAATHGDQRNIYCSGVDPHRLLLLEVMLQQLSVPFFADFTYRLPSTVWEAMNEFPCAVPRKATPAGRNNGRLSSFCGDGGGDGGGDGDKPLRTRFVHSSTTRSNAAFPLGSCAATPSKSFPSSGQRHWFVELTIAQREELMCTSHRMLQRMHRVVCTELEDVFALPLNASTQKGDDDVTAGAPQRWTCPELLGFLSSIRVFEELLDFCLTSCAVIYPQDVEPDAGAALSSSHHKTHAQSETASDGGLNAGGSAERRSSEAASPAVPLAVISPWSCLAVDLHPILSHGGNSVLYSRFMVEHEQRRGMIAYCAAAATRRVPGSGGFNPGASGYGSSLEDDSFLSVHSMASASAAAMLNGSVLSVGTEDSYRCGTPREDRNIQMLKDAASRSCANLQLSLAHSLPSGDMTRPPMVAVVMTAKKNIQLGDVLWWESLHLDEYLHCLP